MVADLEKGTPPAGSLKPASESQSQLSEEERVADVAAQEKTNKVAPAPLDWDGPDDPENPKNWPGWKKFYAIFVPGLISFVVTFGTSVYSAFVPKLMAHFHMSSTVALIGLTLYTLGLVLGPMLGAPISETQGRKAVFLLTFPIAMLFNLGSGLANTKTALFVCRFFAGMFGSPALAIGAGTIADVFDLKVNGGPAAAFFIMMPFLGPSMGPFLGGFIQTLGRRWFAWLLLIISGPVLILTILLHETYKPIILARRAKKRGIPLPPRPPPKVALKLILTVTLVRPFEMLFVEPIVGLMSLYTGFTFGVLFIFFEGYPVAFQEAYEFSIQQVGLTFIGLGIGVISAAGLFVTFDKTIYQKERVKSNNHPEPEHRLYAAMVGAFLIPIGVFWFSWTTYRSVHWISPVLAGLVFGMGNFAIFLSVMTYLVDVYQAHAGASAAAANGVVRYTLGAVFPLFAFQMYHNLGRHWAGSLLGFISILLMPLPFVFFKWGKQIRRKSKYAIS